MTVENEAGKGFLNAAQVGSLRIVKTSSDGKLEGFSFRVTGANGYDRVFQTDAEGAILIEACASGTTPCLRCGTALRTGISSPLTRRPPFLREP